MKPNEVDLIRVKGEILHSGLEKQKSIIDDYRRRIDEARSAACESQGKNYDNNQQTINSEVLAEINILNNELEVANHELEQMMKIDCSTPHQKVEYGSVVETDKGRYFISAGFKDFSAGGKTYCGLSVYSPTYVAMKGKTAGDSFKARDVQYKIESVY